jgi:predicted nucleotidyltransferase
MSIESKLLHLTGDQRIDRFLKKFVNIFIEVFPERIRSVYLRGSYAHGAAISTSDIDLVVIFKENFRDSEESKVRYILKQIGLLSTSRLDAIPRSEEQLLQPDITGIFKSQATIQLSIKNTSVLLFGEDIREKIPTPCINVYTRKCMNDVYYFYTLARNPSKPLSYPINYPEPNAEFYGYDRRQERNIDGVNFNSTRTIVQNVLWSAGALITRSFRLYIYKKKDCIDLYKKYIGDEWTDFIEEVYAKCVNQWSYIVPRSEIQRARLRELCEYTLKFENYFLAVYIDYLIEEQKNHSPKIRDFAVERLTHIDGREFWVLGDI